MADFGGNLFFLLVYDSATKQAGIMPGINFAYSKLTTAELATKDVLSRRPVGSWVIIQELSLKNVSIPGAIGVYNIARRGVFEKTQDGIVYKGEDYAGKY